MLLSMSPSRGTPSVTNEGLRTESWQYNYYMCMTDGHGDILLCSVDVLTTANTVSVYIDCFSKSSSLLRMMVPFTVSGEARPCRMAKFGEPCKKRYHIEG
jgi:hypothetical protein